MSTIPRTAFSPHRRIDTLHHIRATTSAPLMRLVSRPNHTLARPRHGVRAHAAGLGLDQNGIFVDYYELLGVHDDATPETIKSAYRNAAKSCHPDLAGDAGHNICIVLNEAYDTLMNPVLRGVYDQLLDENLMDEGAGYTGKPMSKMPKSSFNKRPEGDTRAVFVDENSCIGCKMCVWQAPGMFRIEPEYGRSRVFGQWLNTEDQIQEAIDACPVSCIHWVEETQLPLLEYSMAYLVERVNVGVMMAGQGGYVPDVFDAANKFDQKRLAREKEAREARKWAPAKYEAARRKAAEKMEKELGSFAAAAFGSFMGMDSDDLKAPASATSGPSASDQDAYREKVKRRQDMRERRARAKGTMRENIDDLARRNNHRTGATVPVERALVVARAYEDGFMDY